MSKEKYLEELEKELGISKKMLERNIAIVGTNKDNITQYAYNSSCAIVRKDNGFNVNYTAVMINEKDKQIEELKQLLADKEKQKLVLEKALELLIKNIELESCFYCPCGNRGCCEDSGKECFTYIKDYFIEQARERLKDGINK